MRRHRGSGWCRGTRRRTGECGRDDDCYQARHLAGDDARDHLRRWACRWRRAGGAGVAGCRRCAPCHATSPGRRPPSRHRRGVTLCHPSRHPWTHSAPFRPSPPPPPRPSCATARPGRWQSRGPIGPPPAPAAPGALTCTHPWAAAWALPLHQWPSHSRWLYQVRPSFS